MADTPIPPPAAHAPPTAGGAPAAWPFRRTLVTGGAGFIGSALVWALNRRGAERVVVCDRLGKDGKWRNLPPLAFEDYLEADDLLPRLERGALGEFDCVLHMGACSATTEPDATYLARNNFEFTKALAEWSLAAARASCTRRARPRTATARRGWTTATTARGAAAAAAAQRVRLQQAAVRPVGGARGALGPAGRVQVLQRLRPQRGPQGRHALARAQGARAGARDRPRAPLPQPPPRLPRRRADARLPVREGLRAHDAAPGRDAARRRGCSTSAAASPTAGSSWRGHCSPPWAASPRSSSSTCPRASATSTSTSRAPTSGSCATPGTTRPVTPLADAVRDYVTNYLTPDRRLGDAAAA
jgi:ADP-L-glycero-D-manno-heptose 6-epimerase